MQPDLSEIIMNPTRMRIIQYLLLHPHATAGQMRSQLDDIPAASLYRHLRILTESGCIRISETRPVRGALEKVYELVPSPMAGASAADGAALIQSSFIILMHSFQRYFSSPNADAQRDLLSFSTSTLMLSDEEFLAFMQKLGEAFNEVIGNTPAPGRKPRRLTIISSPCEEEKQVYNGSSAPKSTRRPEDAANREPDQNL